MVIRAVIIFLHLLLLVRFGGRRIFGNFTSFDIVLGVLLGSVLSRALTANAPFVPTLVAATVLVHRVLAMLSVKSEWVSWLVKGEKTQLIRDGDLLHEEMRKTNVADADLREALRTANGSNDLTHVAQAYLERSGSVSFVLR